MFVALALICVLAPAAWAQPGTADAPGTSKLSGKVLAADGKTAATGVRVIAYHLSTEQVFMSSTTGRGGDYSIADLPYGYFDLAVETADGLYVGNQVINLPPAGKAGVIFTLSSFTSGDPTGRAFAGSEQDSVGMAQMREKLKGREFWRSPKGIAILAGSGGAALLAPAGGGSGSSGGDDGSASPFEP